MLGRRWTVDYGIRETKEKGQRIIRMAVPFRAKDKPSDRSEFGHPDVAILTTHLSYYSMGLSFSQLQEALDHLVQSHNSNDIYSLWIEESKRFNSNVSIKSFHFLF